MTDPYQPPAPPPGYVPYPVYQPAPTNGMGTTSFVLAMAALVLSFIPIVNFIDWLLLPLAVLFGFIGVLQHGRPKGLAIAGLVLGMVGILVMIAGTMFLVALLAAGGSSGR